MDDIWVRIKAGDLAARNALVESCIPLVRYVAGRMRPGLASHADFEDLVSYGFGGLIEATERFDPERNVQFSTFAVQRIRGAILDELRSQDWAPRRVRRNAREIDEAAFALSARLQRDASAAEVADELEIDPLELDARLAEIAASSMPVSLSSQSDSSDEEDQGAPRLSQQVRSLDDVEERGVEADYRHRVATGLGRLEGQERAMLALYYFEDLTFKDIAALLGVTESRVLQMHAGAMRSLRSLATV